MLLLAYLLSLCMTVNARRIRSNYRRRQTPCKRESYFAMFILSSSVSSVHRTVGPPLPRRDEVIIAAQTSATTSARTIVAERVRSILYTLSTLDFAVVRDERTSGRNAFISQKNTSLQRWPGHDKANTRLDFQTGAVPHTHTIECK